MHKRDYQSFPAQARCLLMINQAISMQRSKRMHKEKDLCLNMNESCCCRKMLAIVSSLTMATLTPETESHESTLPLTFEQAVEKHKQEDSTMGNSTLGPLPL